MPTTHQPHQPSPSAHEARCDGSTDDALASFISRSRNLLVLTGAGISTASGSPGYRDAEGNWQRKPPVTHQDFTGSATVRKRYWARSMLGWPMMQGARPNQAHTALATLEKHGRIEHLVTQNVDGLHSAAGSMRVIELHGRLREVRCTQCGTLSTRAAMQVRLESLNPTYLDGDASVAPDGDADLETDFEAFNVPGCPVCDGVLKPDVVFYGDNVPKPRADAAMAAITDADAILVVGSTLMVRSSYKLCEAAHTAGKPIAAINIGRTRADPLLSLKLQADCGSTLAALTAALGV